MMNDRSIPENLRSFVKTKNRGYLHLGRDSRLFYPSDLEHLTHDSIENLTDNLIVFDHLGKDGNPVVVSFYYRYPGGHPKANIKYAYEIVGQDNDELTLRPIRKPEKLAMLQNRINDRYDLQKLQRRENVEAYDSSWERLIDGLSGTEE